MIYPTRCPTCNQPITAISADVVPIQSRRQLDVVAEPISNCWVEPCGHGVIEVYDAEARALVLRSAPTLLST